MHSDAVQSLHRKKTVSWNFKFNLRSTQQSSALKEILPKYTHRSMNKCITFLLREAAFLVRSGLQVTTVATAESGRRTQHTEGDQGAAGAAPGAADRRMTSTCRLP